MGYTGLYWDILGYNGLCWVILGYTGFYRVILGCIGFLLGYYLDWINSNLFLSNLSWNFVGCTCCYQLASKQIRGVFFSLTNEALWRMFFLLTFLVKPLPTRFWSCWLLWGTEISGRGARKKRERERQRFVTDLSSRFFLTGKATTPSISWSCQRPSRHTRHRITESETKEQRFRWLVGPALDWNLPPKKKTLQKKNPKDLSLESLLVFQAAYWLRLNRPPIRSDEELISQRWDGSF